MEKLSSNRAQIFLCNKYTIFTMCGTVNVALLSVNKNFSGELYSSATKNHSTGTLCLDCLGTIVIIAEVTNRTLCLQ